MQLHPSRQVRWPPKPYIPAEAGFSTTYSDATDPVQAEATRHSIFGGLAGKPVLVIGTHFAGPTAGRVTRDGAGYRLLVCW